MVVTSSSWFMVAEGGSRISRQKFQQVVQQQFSPAAKAERDGGEYWDALCHTTTAYQGKTYHVDPLFVLAMFGHESTYGNAGMARTTKSWGNTRPPSFGAHEVGQIPQYIDGKLNGFFSQYASWLDGCISTAARLLSPDWKYAGWGRRTIRSIFDYPQDPTVVWAPAGDYNNPASYLRSVLDTMNTYGDLVGIADLPPPTVDISSFTPPQIVQQWFSPNGVSYLGEPMTMWGVCVHETGNTSSGAEAQQNVNYMRSAACISRQASWHSTVGLEIIETIPDDRQGFHASDGGGPGNTHFMGIEGVMCYPTDSEEFQTVLMNHAWYCAKKLREKGLPLSIIPRNEVYSSGVTLAQHNSFARDRKDCPEFYRDTPGKWDLFMSYANAFYQSGSQSLVDAGLYLPNNPFGSVPFKAGFKDFVQTQASARYGQDQTAAILSIFGYPKREEYAADDGCVYQPTERWVLQYTPGNAVPFDIVCLPRDAVVPPPSGQRRTDTGTGAAVSGVLPEEQMLSATAPAFPPDQLDGTLLVDGDGEQSGVAS
jgi:N-acetylmuramoyl-L-alanine amidase CwlA